RRCRYERGRTCSLGKGMLVRLWHVSELIPEGGQVNSHDGPSPHSFLAGRGGRIWGRPDTQDGARSSLVLGYYQVIPTGFQYGSLRSEKRNSINGTKP